ncbi:hypothetical protein WJX73_006616 [Symbiochloris irregularis]|uniref:Fungal lipase-type domain-containing protein n=1 Tax=Symbiochloris irregularis TaxID=706552 RepID=A0AAW1P8M5_9CHLO
MQALRRNASIVKGESNRLLLTGHSLGGGIALSLLVKFIDAGFLPNWELAGAITFGAPLVLCSQNNDTSAQMLQHYLPPDCRVHNFVNGLDLLPRALGQSLRLTQQAVSQHPMTQYLTQHTTGLLAKGIPGLYPDGVSPSVHRFAPFGHFHFLADGRYLQSADALEQPNLLHDLQTEHTISLVTTGLDAASKSIAAPLKDPAAMHMDESTAIACCHNKNNLLLTLASIAVAPFGILGASAASMQLHKASSTTASGLAPTSSDLSPAVRGTLSNAVACWLLWHLETVKDGATSQATVLQGLLDESRGFHASLQEGVLEARALMADLNTLAQHDAVHVLAKQQSELSLTGSIGTPRARQQALALAVDAVKDAYNDMLKGEKRLTSDGSIRSYAKDLVKAARTLRGAVEAEIGQCDDVSERCKGAQAKQCGLQMKLRLLLHTLMVTAAVRQDFAESILERDLQYSAREAARAELLKSVRTVLAEFSIVEMAAQSFNSCFAGYKALLVALQPPISVACADSAPKSNQIASDQLRFAISSHGLAWESGLTNLSTALQAMMQDKPPSTAHKPASQVLVKVGRAAVMMDELLCNLGMNSAAAGRAWIRQRNGLADNEDTHVKAIQAAASADFANNLRMILHLQLGLVPAVQCRVDASSSEPGGTGYAWPIRKGLAVALTQQSTMLAALEDINASTASLLKIIEGSQEPEAVRMQAASQGLKLVQSWAKEGVLVAFKLIERVLEAPDAGTLHAIAKGIKHLIDFGMAKGFWPAIPALLAALSATSDPPTLEMVCETLDLLTLGEASEMVALLPLNVRRAALESTIQTIKQHAEFQHSLAGKAAHILTKLCGHEHELDKVALKSKVAKELHRLLYETVEPQAAICAALALCQLMDLDNASDAIIAEYVWHHQGVQCFMKLFDFKEAAAKQMAIIGLQALDKRFHDAAQQMLDLGFMDCLAQMLKQKATAADAAKGCAMLAHHRSFRAMLAEAPEFIGRLVAIECGALQNDSAKDAAHAALQDLAKNKDIKRLIDGARYEYLNHT